MFSNGVSSAAPRRLMLLALVLLGLAGRARGGPAKYDAASRSFSLSYTYATLPAYVMTPDQIESLGSLQTATETQDAKFRGVQQAVSQVISQITDGKARIGSLESVDSIKKADIVVSLTGTPDRGGYSQLGAIEGRPGQIVLYYLLLAAEDNQGMINTVAHELCHYVFALPDEYSNGTDCPVSNPGGPGCLMDNYFTRHGFLELCRDTTHNAEAPFPGGLIAPHKATDSCKFWVDKFFEAHPPGPDTSADPGAAGDPAATAAADPPVTSEEPFTGIFKLLVDPDRWSVGLNPAKAEVAPLEVPPLSVTWSPGATVPSARATAVGADAAGTGIGRAS